MTASSDKNEEPAIGRTETVSPSASVNKHQHRRHANRLVIVAIVGVCAIAVIGVLSWVLFFRSGSSGAGRPVPTPRATSIEQSPSPSTTEATVTVSSDVVQRAG